MQWEAGCVVVVVETWMVVNGDGSVVERKCGRETLLGVCVVLLFTFTFTQCHSHSHSLVVWCCVAIY